MYIWHNAILALKQVALATQRSCLAMPMTMGNDCYGVATNMYK